MQGRNVSVRYEHSWDCVAPLSTSSAYAVVHGERSFSNTVAHAGAVPAGALLIWFWQLTRLSMLAQGSVELDVVGVLVVGAVGDVGTPAALHGFDDEKMPPRTDELCPTATAC